MSDREWRDLDIQADRMPYGRAKTMLREEALRLAPAQGATPMEVFWLRMDLTSAYSYGGEPAQALGNFSRCLSLFDADPATYGAAAAGRLRWHFKWMIGNLLEFPQIPLDRITATVDDMERRYREGGHSLQAVHGRRMRLAQHIGDTEAAAHYYELWCTTPRDGNSDCEGCDPSKKASYLSGLGRYEEAVQVAEPVLAGELDCTSQPHGILETLRTPYVRIGRLDAARDAHRRAHRTHRGNPVRHSASITADIAFCAKTGNEATGLRLLERFLPELTAPGNSPDDEMMFAATAALLARRLVESGNGGLPVHLPAHGDTAESATTPEELFERMRARATDLGAQFDLRNGTGTQGEWVRERIGAEPIIEHLPLSAHAPRPAAPRPAPPQQAVTGRRTPAEFMAAHEQAWFEGRQETARLLLDRFDAEAGADLDGPLAARRARAEGRTAEGAAARAPLERAAELFDALGDDNAAHGVRAALGAVLAEHGDESGVPLAAAAVAHLAEHGAPDQHVAAVRALARAHGHTGDLDTAVAVLTDARAAVPAISADPAVGAPFHAHLALTLLENGALAEAAEAAGAAREAARAVGRALLLHDMSALHGQLLSREEGEDAWRAAGAAFTEAAENAAAEGVGPIGRPMSQMLLGRWLADSGDTADAVAPLAEAVAAFTALENPLMAGTAGLLLADCYHQEGRHLEAAEVAEEAVPALDAEEPDGVDRLRARDVLARALTEIGELDGALARWEELIAADAERDAGPTRFHLLEQAAGVLDRLDRDDEAAERFAAAADTCEEIDEPFHAARMRERHARSLMWAGRAEESLEVSARALAWSRRAADDPDLSLPDDARHWQLGTIAYHRARALARLDRTEEAREVAAEALDHMRGTGDDDLVALARELVDDLADPAED
ncbi:hypothetical protein CLV63_106142 [Murinocardiopsis flavida]|uniref:Tetratricopeptide repeat protein n=1 Tax=Murinocardiopsis flavida TaxID=645275 RepID=A0A2P8DLI9_9ACTN|nr:hypothetical protein [Murinocardiopsis flavida]PSK98094.1 hypothetical protein CLV63_106142 [Murinocardiopsis flavida]